LLPLARNSATLSSTSAALSGAMCCSPRSRTSRL
jgi:hypothetical protein